MQTKEKYINASPKIIPHLLKDDGIFPNSMLPLLVYKNVLVLPADHQPQIIEKIFEANNWKNTWRNGIYNYHHYHSTTHEVLGVYSGRCRVLIGGEDGIQFIIEKGDVIIIPAGVAHKNIGGNEDFKCAGAYPDGKDFDMNYGKSGERPQTDHNIGRVPLPATDPVYGKQGPLFMQWIKQPH